MGWSFDHPSRRTLEYSWRRTFDELGTYPFHQSTQGGRVFHQYSESILATCMPNCIACSTTLGATMSDVDSATACSTTLNNCRTLPGQGEAIMISSASGEKAFTFLS